ncbi:MAG: hypothetical protein ABIS17_02520 [Casimicrobiaceae bacterium]
MSTLHILGEDDVRAVIDTDRALEIARATLADQAAGRSILSTPAAMTLDAQALGGPRFKFKAATVGHLGASGIRLLSRPNPGAEACNYCAVYTHGTLSISGLVAELWLSRIRTAAFGAVSIQPLVNPGPLVVALFGTGSIAAEIAPMLQRTLSLREVRVSSRRPESTAAFVARHAESVGVPMRAEADPRRMVDGADVVITLTEATSPLVLPGTLKPGAVVCSMGSYNEIDYGVMREADRLVVDDADFASEMGDGGAWIEQEHLSREAFRARVDALACEVIAGQKSGRRAAADRIVALIQGMAIGDLAFAAYALQEARRTGRGQRVELS